MDLPQEKEMLCAVLGCSQRGLSWRGNVEPIDFFAAKGLVESILSRLGVVAKFEESKDESLCPGRSASVIIDNDKLGVVGELHPKVLGAFELSDAAYLIEIDSDKLLSLAGGLKKYQPIPRYPSTSRDIALLVDGKVTYQQICDVVQKFSLVNSVALFDLYAGEQVPAGKKSLAFRVIYQSPTHTLTDNEVDKVQQQILDKLQHDFRAILRS
jgi:phenylalanyl-tRNA synthetase beta chain